MKIHHIGYLIKNIESAILQFKELGFNVIKEITYDPIRHINVCFMENNNYIIELVSPTDKEAPIYNMLKKYKNMPYHLCYETNNIEKEIERLKNSDFIVIQEPEIAPAIENRKVAFMANCETGIIELIE